MPDGRALTRKDLVIVISLVAACVTTLWAGVQFVDGRFEAHIKQPHPGAVSRDELKSYMDLLLDRLRSIDIRLKAIEERQNQ